MADFDYLAIDPAGREKRGQVAAPTAEAAREKLATRRLYVVRMETGSAAAGPPLVARGFAFRRALGPKQLALFTRQLATLVRVTPLEEALRTIARGTEQPRAQAVLNRVHAAVLEGRRLSDAMGRDEKSFPALYRATVSAGEGSGTLSPILERMADLLERQAQVRGKIVTALAYPLVLSGVAILVVVALMMFVVPQVVEQFDDVGQTLPFLTRAVMGTSAFLVHWWWALLILIGGAGFLGWRALRDERVRLRFDRWLLRTPIIGRLLRDLHAARMARTLSTMIGSRLPLLEGLSLTTRTVHNRALRQASLEIVESIRGGGSLSAALKRAGVFPPLLVTMAASGEAAGQLDLMLARAADYLEREFDTFTTTALSLLEPAIIVVMGAMVALIVLSILLPILQLNTLAGA